MSMELLEDLVLQSWLEYASSLGMNSNCRRAKNGAVILDKTGAKISEGYNLSPYSCDHRCDIKVASSTANTITCGAVHAEIKALTSCISPHSMSTIVCTMMPCNQCIRALAVTHIKEIYYGQPHHHSAECVEFWESAGKKVCQL